MCQLLLKIYEQGFTIKIIKLILYVNEIENKYQNSGFRLASSYVKRIITASKRPHRKCIIYKTKNEWNCKTENKTSRK